MASYYSIPDQFVGKNINALASSGGGNVDLLSQILGVGREDPFTQGQTFKVNQLEGINPGSSTEYRFINSNFTPSDSPEQKAAKEFNQQNQDTLQAAKTEAVGTLQSGKQPLKDRYNEVISSIKGVAEQRLTESDTATAREYGKRGIPLTSGVYDTAVQQGRAPIDAATAAALSSTALQEQQQLGNIDQAIASIQSATGMNQVQAALQAQQIAEQARQFGISFEEGVRQFNEQLSLQKSSQQPQQNPFSNFTTLGEGQTLFDLLTGQPVYQAPKTYKPESSGGGDSLGLF